MCYQLKSEDNCGEIFNFFQNLAIFQEKKLEYFCFFWGILTKFHTMFFCWFPSPTPPPTVSISNFVGVGDHWQEVIAKFGYGSER